MTNTLNLRIKELEDCKWAIEVINEPDPNILVNRMEGVVNSEFSDFGSTTSRR